MKAILNLGKKTLKAISERPEYKSLLEAEGKEVEYIILPQPVLNKKDVQASIKLQNGEEWTVFADQLIIEKEEPTVKRGILNIPHKHLKKLIESGIYDDLILANGTEVDFKIVPQPAISKDMVLATVILNDVSYGVNLKYIN